MERPGPPETERVGDSILEITSHLSLGPVRLPAPLLWVPPRRNILGPLFPQRSSVPTICHCFRDRLPIATPGSNPPTLNRRPFSGHWKPSLRPRLRSKSPCPCPCPCPGLDPDPSEGPRRLTRRLFGPV